MKKCGIMAVILSICVMLAGCGSHSVEEVAKNSISELHINYFSGSTQNFAVSMWSGLREEPYSADGVKNNMVEFCILSIVPKGGFDAQAVEYTAEINDQTYSGVFERSPFDKSLASDLNTSLQEGDEIFVYLILNGETEIARLDSVSAKFVITNSQAIDIFVEHFGCNAEVFSHLNDPVEGYCKIISTDQSLGIYFWYVCLFNAQNERAAVVIDPQSGQIVAETVTFSQK